MDADVIAAAMMKFEEARRKAKEASKKRPAPADSDTNPAPSKKSKKASPSPTKKPQYAHVECFDKAKPFDEFGRGLDDLANVDMQHSNTFWGLGKELVTCNPELKSPAMTIFNELKYVYPKNVASKDRLWGCDETFGDLQALASLIELIQHPKDYGPNAEKFVQKYTSLEIAHMYLRRSLGLRFTMIRYWSPHLNADQPRLLADAEKYAAEEEEEKEKEQKPVNPPPPQEAYDPEAAAESEDEKEKEKKQALEELLQEMNNKPLSSVQTP